ncbi:MAG: radical SAM protein [Spirochaetales bacterium]|nr:radical SAM protein [Spirochaetales bacterium]
MISSILHKLKAYSVFSRNILLSAFDRSLFPYKLTFAITGKCNLRCRTCYVWKKKSLHELSFEEIDKFFTINNYFNWIDLTGGEIFLRKDLLDITKSIKKNVKNLVMLHYPTNGFLTEKIIQTTEQIASMDFHNLVLTVSIDGNEEVHNTIRNKENSFKRCIDTYRELKKNKHIKVYIGCTLSPFNIDHFKTFYRELRDYLPDLAYSDIHLNIYHYSENLYSNEKLEVDKKRIIDIIEDFIKKKGFLFINPIVLLEYVYLKNIKRYFSNNRFPFKCRAGEISCFIDPQGNVYPCSGYNVLMGSLRKDNYDLLTILHHEENITLTRNIKRGKCPHCWTPCEAYQNILSNLFIRRKSNEVH